MAENSPTSVYRQCEVKVLGLDTIRKLSGPLFKKNVGTPSVHDN